MHECSRTIEGFSHAFAVRCTRENNCSLTLDYVLQMFRDVIHAVLVRTYCTKLFSLPKRVQDVCGFKISHHKYLDIAITQLHTGSSCAVSSALVKKYTWYTWRFLLTFQHELCGGQPLYVSGHWAVSSRGVDEIFWQNRQSAWIGLLESLSYHS